MRLPSLDNREEVSESEPGCQIFLIGGSVLILIPPSPMCSCLLKLNYKFGNFVLIRHEKASELCKNRPLSSLLVDSDPTGLNYPKVAGWGIFREALKERCPQHAGQVVAGDLRSSLPTVEDPSVR